VTKPRKTERVRIKGGRDWKAAGFDPRVLDKIVQTMDRFDTTASHVIDVGMADFFGIELDDALPKPARPRAIVRRAGIRIVHRRAAG
jgi:hypothetical protein